MNELNNAINRIIQYIKDKHTRPATVKYKGAPVALKKFFTLTEITKAKKRYNDFLKINKRYPKTLKIGELNYTKEDYSIFYDLPVIDKNINHDDVYDYFCKKFKKVNSIDEAFKLINGKGYGHYFNNKLSNKQVIDELKKGNANVNCTDATQMCYHLAKALGYDVKIIHVKCRGGDGHVRMDLRHLKHTGGNWIHRDPACVISPNGKPVTACWCLDGSLIGINPNWFIETINY